MGFEDMESSDVLGVDRNNHCGCTSGCVCQVVRAIKDIQDEAVEDECLSCTSSCFIEPLGDLALPTRERADTRVFTLTNKDGDLFKGLFRGHDGKCVSVYFRVEEIFDNCCATLRVLIPLKKDRTTVVKIMNNGKIDYEELCSVRHWARSNSCITVDLHCFCAVQCIADVDLEICE
ncbi:CotY/CotZ family spore coat protein [Lederbergia graminis]|uniref:CotY/CotZ family spore coat protein n=1 Tax=Lederbergia graminis TaxID=735518 RepID=A0ABW0LG73_9BACI